MATHVTECTMAPPNGDNNMPKNTRNSSRKNSDSSNTKTTMKRMKKKKKKKKKKKTEDATPTNAAPKKKNVALTKKKKKKNRQRRERVVDPRVKVVLRLLPVEYTADALMKALDAFDGDIDVELLYFNRGQKVPYGRDVTSTAFVLLKSRPEALTFVRKCQDKPFVIRECDENANDVDIELFPEVEIAPFQELPAPISDKDRSFFGTCETDSEFLEFKKRWESVETQKYTMDSKRLEDAAIKLSESEKKVSVTKESTATSLVQFVMRIKEDVPSKKRNKPKRKSERKTKKGNNSNTALASNMKSGGSKKTKKKMETNSRVATESKEGAGKTKKKKMKKKKKKKKNGSKKCSSENVKKEASDQTSSANERRKPTNATRRKKKGSGGAARSQQAAVPPAATTRPERKKVVLLKRRPKAEGSSASLTGHSA